MSVETFELDMTRFVRKAKGRMDVVVRKIAFDLCSGVIVGRPHGDGTPVDTGRARNGWFVEIGHYTKHIDPPQGTTFDKSGREALSKALAVLNRAFAGDVIYLTNNVSYIKVLEYGRDDGTPGSRQAPNGMLRVALATFPGIVRRNVQAERFT